MALSGPRDQPFGVYVHWPYCARICPYCDFNVYRDRGEDHDALVAAILADIDGWRARTGPRAVSSIHFGGGTPSRLRPREVAALIDAVARAWTLDANAEIGLELNPEDVDRLADFRAAGVNRASLGVQALDDAALADLGRAHSADDARRAVARARDVFERASIDLIYARTGQTLGQWERELGEALSFGLEHLSAYQLTIEPGTAFARQVSRKRRPDLASDDAAGFYALTQGLCDAAGYRGYEISNHARASAARSRHNLLYWRSHEWAGLGPGAHGRLGATGGATSGARGGRRALTAARTPQDYAGAVRAHGWGVTEDEALDAPAQAIEFVLMALRLQEGVPLARWRELAGAPPAAPIAELVGEGLLRVGPGAMALTAKGKPLADRVAADLCAHLD